MLTELKLKHLKSFYQNHLDSVLLPFWLKNSIDNEYGGYYTCFENTGSRLVTTDKYTWSQGRLVWVFSKLSCMSWYSGEQKTLFLKLAKSGAEFLIRNCLLKNGNCTFLMDRAGRPKLQSPGQELDTSFYADCFVILGLSRYAAVSNDIDSLEFALRLYYSVYNRVQSNTFKSEPYPVPKGYRHHGPPMIMLNISQELAAAMKKLGNNRWVEISHNADIYMQDILEHFVADDYVLHEMIDENNNFVLDTLMGTYINPGHILEDMWFVMHQAVETGNTEVVDKAAKIVKKAFETGWDKKYGGILLFAGQNGGKPYGSTIGIQNNKMVHKVLNDWDSKLWWPHSEALYTALLSYTLTNDTEFLDMYDKVYKYTFKTFPNPDSSIGEWIQIRDRKGNPEQKVVALPVKDPFHIIRNIILIIDLLNKTHQMI